MYAGCVDVIVKLIYQLVVAKKLFLLFPVPTAGLWPCSSWSSSDTWVSQDGKSSYSLKNLHPYSMLTPDSCLQDGQTSFWMWILEKGGGNCHEKSSKVRRGNCPAPCPRLEMPLPIHHPSDFVCFWHLCLQQSGLRMTKQPRVFCKIHISNALPCQLRDLFALKAHRALCVYHQAGETSRLITLVRSQLNKCIF